MVTIDIDIDHLMGMVTIDIDIDHLMVKNKVIVTHDRILMLTLKTLQSFLIFTFLKCKKN